MKKLVFSLAVLFSVAMVSCGGNKAAEATDTDTMVAVEETVVEAVDSNDTTVAVEAAAEVAEAPGGSFGFAGFLFISGPSSSCLYHLF